jgi:chromatin remodeling complex protein RSC6
MQKTTVTRKVGKNKVKTSKTKSAKSKTKAGLPKAKIAKSKAKTGPPKAKTAKSKTKAKTPPPDETEDPDEEVEDPADNEGEEYLDNEEEDGDLDNEGVKKRRTKPTIYDHIAHYNQLLELIKAEVDRKSRSKENGVRPLQKARKMIEIMRKELPHVTRSKEAKMALSTRKNTSSGFTIKYYVSEELANFLQIDASIDTVSRVDVTRAICVYSHLKPDEQREETLEWAYLNPGGERDLQNPANKRTILPDKTLSALLRYDNYKRDVKAGKIKQKTTDKITGIKGQKVLTESALNYNTIQPLISHHLLEAVPSEKVEDAEELEEENAEEAEAEEEENLEEVEDEY